MKDMKLLPDDRMSEKIQDIWNWNSTVPPAVERCIHELFIEQANTRPNAPAICAWDGEATYGKLDELSTQLAGHLVKLSIGPEDIVPLCFEKSMWTVVAMLAVLKAGGAFAPLDPEHPQSRQEAMLEQTKAKVVLTSARHSTLWAGSDRTAVVVSEASMQDLSTASSARSAAQTGHAAYVIFTSGSTGVPKGVVLEHKAASTSCLGHGRAFRFSSHTRALQFASYTFDACILEILTTLVYGGCVCVPSEGSRLNNLAHVISSMNVNWADLTPSVARLLNPDAVLSLETLVFMGEQVHIADWERWEGSVRRINGYGPTECCVTCCIFSDTQGFASGLIGKAVASVSWVVDPDNHDKLAPLGSTGELLVEGPILARGYLNDAEKTAAAFINDPEWLVEGGGGQPGRRGRLYKTGDLVRYDEDGNLVYVGRKDGQVKIRGQRVELGEIESVLSSQEEVSDAIIVLQHRNAREAQLAAFVTLSLDKAVVHAHVNTWRERFTSDVYSSVNTIRSDLIGRDFLGWTAMEDGNVIDRREMNEWLDDTIDTILSNGQPENILEIGSGTGMILFNLGDIFKSYVGLDPSMTAVQFIETTAKSIPALAGKVRMHEATAADIGLFSKSITADLVIVNSVIQYFPSQDYLFKVVEDLLEINGVKTLFFGDVRSHALQKQFLATRALRGAGQDATKADVLRIMADMEQADMELLVDPAFFTALPSRLPHLVRHVEILPKKMRATNELSCYRYAAVVHVRTGGRRLHQFRRVSHDSWIDFTESKLDRQSLVQQLKHVTDSRVVAVSNIPHSKTAFSRCLLRSLEDTGETTAKEEDWLLSVERSAHQLRSLSTMDLVDLARETNCRVEISWSRQYLQYGGFDAVFHRTPSVEGSPRTVFQFPDDHHEGRPNGVTSKPLEEQVWRKVQRKLYETLHARIPSYMIPRWITKLDKIPLTKSGKRDRKALEAYTSAEKLGPSAGQQPTSEGERTMQQLWARVLNMEPESIGVDDSFFRLGGDSITAMQLVAEARKRDVQLTVEDIFRHPKLVHQADLSNRMVEHSAGSIAAFSLLGPSVDAAQIREEVAAACSVDVHLVEDVHPCSPLQEGLVSLTSKNIGDYIMRYVLEMRAEIDEATFRAAWERVVQSAAILRTRIVHSSGLGLVQAVIGDDFQWVQAEGLAEYLEQDKAASMGLGEPLARYALVREPHAAKRWFVWTAHHALFDGWSLPQILASVETAYGGGEVFAQEPDYRAFIRYLGQQDQEAAAAYWQTSLANCTAGPFPPLPSTVQQPVADGTVGYQCPPLAKAASDTTTSTLIRAAWAIIASRYTDSEDVVFGATLTGRNAPVAGIETMVGPTIATVPVRVRAPRDQAVSAFLKALQQQAMEMIPFEQTGLHRIAKIGADGQRACGFQTLLVVQPGDDVLGSKSLLGEWQSYQEVRDFATYALTIQCTLNPDGIGMTASFDSRVTEQWVVERMLAQFSFVMQQLARADLSAKMADIDTLAPDDKQQLWTWNSEVPPAVDRCIHELFIEQANARPAAPAICAWDGEATYRELDELSTKLAGHLVRLGVKAEDIMPLCFEKSMWTVVAMLAVLKAGGTFTPLDPEHPLSRREEILQQTRARVVLTSTQHSTLWAGSDRTAVVVSEASMQDLPSTASSARSAAQTGHAAYIIFTSGSTGVPKGVVLEHRAVSTSCLGHGRAFGFSSHTRALQFASYTFDACITEIFTTLLYGGCVCIPSEDSRRNELAQAINCMNVNWAFLTPSVARLLDPATVLPLATLVLGGEQVSVTDWDRWQGRVRTMNGYGPTECCVFCISFTSTQDWKSGVIGKAVASVGWVVDPNDHGKLAPLGSTGELLVEGPILARDYINGTDKTAAAFVNDPAWLVQGGGGQPGRRGKLYKTGDLVRYEEDGNLIYVGRKDSQIKIRGQRVELGEIEHHVSECMPEARQVAVEVIAPAGEKEKAMVAAFVQLDESTRDVLLPQVVFPAEADDKLAGRLPGYMVPEVYFALARLPMTTSGKTDRRRLREMGASFSVQQLAELRTQSQGQKRQPSTEKEKTLQRLWARVLNIRLESIGLDDSFFRLGGDSITAMQLSAAARSLQIHLSTRDVFRRKTIAELVRYSISSKSLPLPSRGEDVVNIPFGLTPIQELYLRLEPTGRASFDQSFYLELRTQVALESLRSALRTLVQRHSMLRARFNQAAGSGWQQYVSDATDASFTVQHVRPRNAADLTQVILQNRCHLDIEHGPVMTAVLCDTAERQSLFMAIHHLVIDLVSWRVLLEELEDLLLGRPLSPASSSTTFQSWRALQAEYAARDADTGDTTEETAEPSQLSYWGATSDHTPHVPTTAEHFVLGSEATSALLGDCNEAFRTRPHELMLAALIYAFAAVFPDRNPPPIFNETHGREPWDDSIDISRTVGWFTSMFPVQVPGGMRGSLLDVICATKDCMRSFKHNGRSYFASRLANEEAARSFASIFPVEVVFNYQGTYQQLERDGSLFKSLPLPDGCAPASAAEAARMSLFTVSVVIVDGCAQATVVHSGVMKRQTQVAEWIQRYEATLMEMTGLLQGRSPQWSLTDLSLPFNSYRDLDRFRDDTLVELGLRPEDVEDVYPCSPMQEGILASQSRDPAAYRVCSIFEAVPAPNAPNARVDCARLQQAWRAVVRRHSLLRALLVDNVPGSPGTTHVVLRDPQPSVSVFQAAGVAVGPELFRARYSVADQQAGGLQHHLSICELRNEKVYLCLDINHAIIDAHSTNIIMRDLQMAYSADLRPRGPPFRNFISYLKQQSQEEAGRYWAKNLDGIEPCHFPSMAEGAAEPRRDERVQVPGLDAGVIHAFCRVQETTLATVIQTAWALVLARYAGSAVPCFGVLSSGRDAPIDDVEDIFGPLIAMLPFQVRLNRHTTVQEVLRSVQSDYTNALQHQAFSLASVHNMLQLGRTALFNTALSLQRVEDGRPGDMPEVAFRFQDGQDPTEYDIALAATYSNTTIDIGITFRRSCMNAVQAKRLAVNLGMAIGAITATPNSRVQDLELTTNEDVNQVWTWNGEVPPAVDRCIHELFIEQANARPHAPAICAWDGKVTYGKLDELSTKLAGQLTGLGVGPEDMVPLCFEKSIWTVVAMLAVLKAGGAFIPLDPEHPLSRQEAILEQAKAKVVLTSARHSALWAGSDRTAVVVSEASMQDLPSTASSARSVAQTGHAAYIIFTSGSTGVPKGVVLEHRAVSTSCLGHGRAFGFSSYTRALQFASYTFDACITEIFTTLLYGGCVCIPSETDRSNDLSNVINTLAVNFANLTPTVARLLHPDQVPLVSTLALLGEQVTCTDWERWDGRVRQINSYGPTECAVVCSAYVGGVDYKSGLIGKAVASVSWVVDPDNHDRLAPLGSTGELLVEGPTLARGYLNDADKTAAAFINDPEWLVEGGGGQPGRRGRLYKTGDLVRYDEDGNLVYVGRKDGQVKIRGQRVELGEIEHHLSACLPEARQVVVEVIAPTVEEETVEEEKAVVAAFLQLDESTQDVLLPMVVFPAEADDKLAGRLPSHMVPEVYFAVARIPMTTSGKTDRRRLREIGASFSVQQLAELRTQSQGPKRQPSTEKEKTLRRLWAWVLGIDAHSIGLDDSFFRLGGDSIAAMKLVAEARKEGLTLAVADVFRTAQLGHLADQTGRPQDNALSFIPRVAHSGPVAQSFAQGRLWFLEELHPALEWYLMPFAVRITGALRLDALEAALQAIERRHETLRTTFSTSEGIAVQEVHPFRPKELNVVDISLDNEQDLFDVLQRDQTTPFDLRSEPGWRVCIYRFDGQHNHVLSIVMHHIISDGWSQDVFQRELSTLYSAAIRGQDLISRLPPLSIQYREFSVWQRQQEQVEEHQRQLDYWITELQTSRPAEFLSDYPRPATFSGKAGTHQLKIDGQLYSRLQQFCRARGVTLFVVLLAAFRATHYRLTGQDDATIGAPNANRDRWELKDMIGFFVNMQCLRIRVGNKSFEELIEQVRTAVVASLDNQDVPFEQIVSRLQRDRDLSRHPIVQVAFAVHSQKDLGKLSLEGVEAEAVHGSATSRFDLECHFYPEQEGLQGYVLFSTDLYVAETISSLVSVFQGILDKCLDEPEMKIASMPLLTAEAYTQLDQLGLIRMEQTPYPRESGVVDLFREQAAAHPSRAAVKDSSGEMTYAQLDELSDNLARWLAGHLLAPETLIGVFADRSCQAIMALLAILKAGLAYLPFDVKIPGARMEAILSSAEELRLVLVGDGVQPPKLSHDNIKFVHIAEALTKSARSQSVVKQSDALVKTSATSLAYVMFTSGSTGQPKGVMVEHRGIVRLVKDGNLARLLPHCGAMAHVSNLAFDASTWEIYAALLNGMTLACIDTMEVLDQTATFRIFTEWDVRTAFLTTALFRQYAVECPEMLTALTMLCVGGERLDQIHLFQFMKIFTGKFVHVYGPTENTTFSTSFYVPKTESFVNSVPIGRAISNSGAYVMDQEQQLVPLGVIGELVVTGDGLARGYTDPARNVDRFVTVTVGEKTMRAYRTGDFVRYRPTDGQLEFFGRIDGQVKIRGHRVELEEIENVLRSHRSVRDAVIVPSQSDNDHQKLVGYVTLGEGSSIPEEQLGDAGQSQHVDGWEDRFDSETYAQIDDLRPEAIGKDFAGWTSMYDGSEISKVEMNEWLDDTMRTIYTAVDGRPGNVLEIGSGTGMILFNLLEGLQSYVGLDPSRRAVRFIEEAARSIPSLADKVRMYKATAADIGHIELANSVDFVVLNSVVQYFPSQDYLFKVIQGFLNLKGVKTMFFGDVRSYALHRDFLVSRALRMVGDGASKKDIRRMVRDMEQVERELLVDPGFFTALPSRLPELVEHVEILPKRMKATNELSCYRYAAIVYVKAGGRPEREVQQIGHDKWVDFEKHKLNRQSLLQQLESLSSSSTVAISNIPHSKNIFSRDLLGTLEDSKARKLDQRDWVASIREVVEQTPSLSAVDLVELAEEAGCRVEISWSRQYSQQGGLDAVFYQCQPETKNSRVMFRFPTDHANRPRHSLSSKPLRQQLVKEVQQQLEEALRAQLPEYMIPQSINVLENLPINGNGKVDRSTLAQRTENRTTSQRSIRQPSTEAERTMQRLWVRILNIDAHSIGLDDSFFRLGGDSIAAMKLVAEARKERIQLSVADIFRNPKLVTLAGLDCRYSNNIVEEIPAFSLLGEFVDLTQVRQEVAASCSIDASLIEDIYPCSPLQEGLMSLTSKRAGDYIMQAVLELREDTDEEAFRAAWDQVVQSTQVLRTRILLHSKLGLLQAVTAESIQWSQADGLDDYLERDREASMGLGEHLVRYALVREGNGHKRWFVWTIHHSLYDGWSLPRIFEAVKNVYGGGVTRVQPGFQAFIKHLGQQDQEAAVEYWQTTLADCQATPFPASQSTVQQLVADKTVQYLCPPLLEKFSDTTKSTLVRAAWAIVASRYTNTDDVIFGTVVTGRNAPVAGIEDILGPTIATVPVRVHVANDQTIPAYLKALQQQATEMIPFEQTGLQQIAKMSPGARHACNFQTLLVVQPANDGLVNGGILGMWRGSSELQNFTTYALALQCILAPQGVQMMASFDSRAIEQQQVEKILSQLSFVMQQLACVNDHTVIGNIEMLTPKERQLLWTWNCEVPPAVERCVHDLFMEQARARSDAPAICAWDGELTYGKLDELSTQLAGHLIELSVGPEDVVPLCFEKSMWTVVAMLAVLKAGGAFTPLDPEHPRSRHEEILQQTRARVVLTSAQHSTLWAGSDRTAVVVSEASMQDLPSTASSAYSAAARTSYAAYIIFTSGSTGVPKGVVLEHRAVSTSCLGHGKAFGFSSHTRALQFASYTFDACILEILTTLVYGGCICVLSEGSRWNNLAQVISDMNVNWADLTPSMARLLDPDTIPSLKTLVFMGEQVRVADWGRWERNIQRINGYGPAECCVACCVFSDTQGFTSGLIGKAVASIGWVVDPNDHSKLAPLGSIGELLVEGPILARGYLNDVKKTADAFIHDPAWLLQGSDRHTGRQGRLYKTGDLVRYDEDGNMIYVGRKDSQIKIRGQRVELGEIEHHLSECMPEARQVAVEVIAPAGEKEKAMVAAFVQLDESMRDALLADSKPAGKDKAAAQVIFPAEADDKLARRLPSHMVPEVYFAVARIPMTTSGKTDRRRLREMGASFSVQQLAEMLASNQGPKRTPSTKAERTIQQLWARVLNIKPETIGVDDNFFRLGGDSIAAMKLVTEVRKEGFHLTVADIIRSPWLNALAGQIMHPAHGYLNIVPQVNFFDNEADFALESRVSSSLVIDWDMETAPPESSAVPKLSNVPLPKDKPKVVVLTGCTGLLGKHLLSALLTLRSIRKVICLAVRRLSERLDTKQLPPPNDRIIYYEGNLTQPRFGLSESKWAATFSETDAVIHIGADTSHIKYYSALRGVNVESTKQLVHSCLQYMVPIHYVSSASIAMLAELDIATATSCTKTGFSPPPDGAQGYICSKWVCESMLERVHAKYGLRVVIQRPSAIMREGDDHMLEGARFDFMNEFLHYVHKTQRVPQMESTAGDFDLVSVGTCCNDIIRALLQETSDDGRITYVNSVSDMVIPKAELASIGLSKVGRAYEVLTTKEWRKTAVAAGMHPAVAALI